jgi:intracellular septation protein A/8-oxo-dGTP pyrophosphatase MutT (NUDIX family)
MDKFVLMRKMAIGLLPLLVFIAADEIFGTEIGLIVAIITGIGQLIYFYIREKRFEKFVLIDTALILLLGGISLISHNDLFFKIKPGLIELILVAVLGVSVFTPKNIMLEMQKRYLGDISIGDEQLKSMKLTLLIMFWVFFAHTALVFYSAFFMSKEAWAFISTALFYIIFGLVFVFQLVSNKLKKNNIEWLPLLDPDGKVIGKAPREVCKKDKSLIYPVIRLHVFNSKGQIFLQKRKKNAPTQAGKWDAAVAGHVIYGENIEQAVLRESLEELNLSGFDFFLLDKNMFYGETTTAMIFVFGAITDNPIIPNLHETDGGNFYDLYQIKNLLGEENLSAGLLKEWPILVKLRKSVHK